VNNTVNATILIGSESRRYVSAIFIVQVGENEESIL